MAVTVCILLAIFVPPDVEFAPVAVEEAIAQLATARGGTYVLTPSASEIARKRTIRFCGSDGGPSGLRTALGVAVGLRGWDSGSVTVWFSASEAPELMAADMRWRDASSGAGGVAGARLGALDLEGASPPEALASVVEAFNLSVAVLDAEVIEQPVSVRIQVDGVEARQALAILADALNARLELHGEVVLVRNRQEQEGHPGALPATEAEPASDAATDHRALRHLLSGLEVADEAEQR